MNTAGGGDNPGGDPTQLVVTNGLAAYYQFNDTYDDTMGTYDGFGINNPTFASGISGQAVKFSKTNNSSVSIPYGLINSNSFSVSFWATNLSDGLLFYSKCSDNNDRFSLSIINGSLSFKASKYNNYHQFENQNYIFSHPGISDGKWHHIAITANYGSVKQYSWTTTLYIDGKKVGVVTENLGSVLSESETTNTFVIGGTGNFGTRVNACDYTCDNFRVYDTRELTAAQVKEIFDAKQ